MILRRFYQEQLVQASYLLDCSEATEAAIIDPNRNVDQYLTVAAQEGMRIVAVTETHIHADFFSSRNVHALCKCNSDLFAN